MSHSAKAETCAREQCRDHTEVPEKTEPPIVKRITARESSTTYRVRGIPLEWDIARLQEELEQSGSTNATARSLVPRIDGRMKEATVFFPGQRRSNVPQIGDLAVDQNFHGLTTLFAPAPEKHEIDVVAITGIGGHAFGSFQAKATPGHDGRSIDFMWLRDCLPHDLVSKEDKSPMARIMTYGYESNLVDSDNYQSLDDLAKHFAASLSALAQTQEPKPVMIIAHSLGGLIAKRVRYETLNGKCLLFPNGWTSQAFIMLKEAPPEDTHGKLYRSVFGFIFFGVPNDGMETDHLIAMAGGNANLFLVLSLSRHHTSITTEISRNFKAGLAGDENSPHSEVHCFYETVASPLPEKNSNDRWEWNNKKSALLVSQPSATRYCTQWNGGLDRETPIPLNHSEMVKFGPHDDKYDIVRSVLQGIASGARVRKPGIDGTGNALIQTTPQQVHPNLRLMY